MLLRFDVLFFMCLLLSSFDTTKAKKVFVLISMDDWMDVMGRIGQEIGVSDRLEEIMFQSRFDAN